MSVFFSSRKNVFEKLARHLLYSWLSVELPKAFSYRNLDNTSTPGGSIKKVYDLSTAPRHLVDRSSIILASGIFLPWHSICRCCFFSTFARQMARHHLDTSSVEIYWWSLNTPRAICSSLLSIYLSFFQTFHLLNLSHSLQTSSPGILKLSSLGKLLISFIYMHFMF